jgi:phosphate transport system permease protein
VILGLSRAIGESMIAAIAVGGLANLTADAREPMTTMTAFIVQLSQSDTPTGSIAFKTIFAVGSTLFAMTLILNILSVRFVRRFREQYE